MIQEILEIAKQNPEGFTYDLATKKFVKLGYSVGYEATQSGFGVAGCQKAIDHALLHNKIVGGWLSSKNNQYYFDSCKIFFHKSAAIKFGIENKQISIFDLTNGREITI